MRTRRKFWNDPPPHWFAPHQPRNAALADHDIRVNKPVESQMHSLEQTGNLCKLWMQVAGVSLVLALAPVPLSYAQSANSSTSSIGSAASGDGSSSADGTSSASATAGPDGSGVTAGAEGSTGGAAVGGTASVGSGTGISANASATSGDAATAETSTSANTSANSIAGEHPYATASAPLAATFSPSSARTAATLSAMSTAPTRSAAIEATPPMPRPASGRVTPFRTTVQERSSAAAWEWARRRTRPLPPPGPKPKQKRREPRTRSLRRCGRLPVLRWESRPMAGLRLQRPQASRHQWV